MDRRDNREVAVLRLLAFGDEKDADDNVDVAGGIDVVDAAGCNMEEEDT